MWIRDRLQAEIEALKAENGRLRTTAGRVNSLLDEVKVGRFKIVGLEGELENLQAENDGYVVRLQDLGLEYEEAKRQVVVVQSATKLSALDDEDLCLGEGAAQRLVLDGGIDLLVGSLSSARLAERKLEEAGLGQDVVRLGIVDQPEEAGCPQLIDNGLAVLRWKGEPQHVPASLFSRDYAEARISLLPFADECPNLLGLLERFSGEVWVADGDWLALCDLTSGQTRRSRADDDIGFLFVQPEFLGQR